MKPQDLTLEQLKAIPLKDYDDAGFHKKGGIICDIYDISCERIECDICCLDSPESIERRILELKA